jgi:hypothetical protein
MGVGIEDAMFAEASEGRPMKNLRVREEPGDFHYMSHNLGEYVT